ncbi:cytochrome P450 [Apiospora kogelbergensis]|uniref:cytochrome P450 n=1 Tax=Apiospora kogelbergensis TaxID=1337665 RepID=UPI00312CD51F
MMEVATMTILRFGVRPRGGQWSIPTVHRSNLGISFKQPDHDVEVEIRVRDKSQWAMTFLRQAGGNTTTYERLAEPEPGADTVRMWHLTSLDSVLHASPVVYRIFEEHAVGVTDSVLACDDKVVVSYNRHPNGTEEIHHGPHAVESGITCSFIRIMFNIMAAIRSSNLPVYSLAEFHKNVCDPFWWKVTRAGRNTRGYFMPESLPKNTPPRVVRSLIATYRAINWLSLDCLKSYLDRFKNIRPSHPTTSKKALKEILDRTTPLEEQAMILRKGRLVTVEDIGPPSWTEEQRVTRAFWRLHLLSDLKNASRSPRLLVGWPRSDIEALGKYDASQLLGLYVPSETANTDRLVIEQEYPEEQEILSVLDFLRTQHKGLWPHQLMLPSWEQQHLELATMRSQQRWSLPRHEPRGDKKLASPSAACRAWHRLNRSPWHFELRESELSFVPFRWLGFAFWSEERMLAYKVLGNPDEIGWYSRFKYGFAWDSIEKVVAKEGADEHHREAY